MALDEKLDKILPLDEEILAELVADESSIEEEVTAEIGRAARLKADVTERLVAINERLTVTNVPYSESNLNHWRPGQAQDVNKLFNTDTVTQRTIYRDCMGN